MGKVSCFRWKPTSRALLDAAENRMFAHLKTPFKGTYVNVGRIFDKEDCQIWTISINENSSSQLTPLVLLHGLASGVGFWSFHLDAFSANGRPVYAIDLPGFAKSSRPKFSKDPAKAEHQFLKVIEEWRMRVGPERFILASHSFGGYLSLSYTLANPDKIAHLILIEPWGLTRPRGGLCLRTACSLCSFNPLFPLRVFGPLGPCVVNCTDGCGRGSFATLYKDKSEGHKNFLNYTYHANSQANPTGEKAFKTLSLFWWARLPLVDRIKGHMKTETDVTITYGAHSFIARLSLEEFKNLRSNNNSYTSIEVLDDAGHMIVLDQKEEVKRIVVEVMILTDEKEMKRQNTSLEEPTVPDENPPP